MTRLLTAALLAVAALLPSCAQTPATSPATAPTDSAAASPKPFSLPGPPVIRTRLLEAQSAVALTATAPPLAHSAAPNAPSARVNFTPGSPSTLSLTPAGWVLGGVTLGPATHALHLTPAVEGSVAVNDRPYRGTFRFVPVAGGKFDVVNDVDVDDYLKSVVPREMYPKWHAEAYKAQAIVARTYAIYEARSAPAAASFDVDDDTRSQVYGGLKDETPAAVSAVTSTRGIVTAYGPQGAETIFKTYFSACCGGKGANAYDAFGDPPAQPLSEKDTGAACATLAPRFNWGPVTLAKSEVTRRLRLYGQKKNRAAEAAIGNVARVDIGSTNSVGRPVRFLVTDTAGTRYSIPAEQFRHAMNTDGKGTTLYSSFFTPVTHDTTITFTNAHGHGHGVGLCQWCTQARAAQGTRHEDLVLVAYPGAKLIRAY